jgi:hypothetical protein
MLTPCLFQCDKQVSQEILKLTHPVLRTLPRIPVTAQIRGREIREGLTGSLTGFIQQTAGMIWR